MTSLNFGDYSFEMHDDGCYDITTPATRLAGVHAEARINDSVFRLPLACKSASGSSALFETERLEGRFTLAVNIDDEGIRLNLSCELKAYPRDIELSPFAMETLTVDQLVCQGRRMGRCFIHSFPMAPSGDPALEDGRLQNDLISHFYIGARFGKKHLLFSTPLRNRLHCEFGGKLTNTGVRDFRAFAATCHEDCLSFESGELAIAAGDDPFKMTFDWSERNVEVLKTNPAIFAPGWNSWDYYRWTITEEQVLANADFIRRDPVLSKHIRRIILDDGWQYCYGEWEPNHFFPHGMKYLTDEIAKMGFEPGLWLAPAIIEPHTQIAQLHPEWLAMGESGQPCFSWQCMGRHAGVLDPTVPEVQQHIRNLFDKYAGYGYKYFKLDFLFGAMQARQYHDRTIPHTDIVRLIVKSASEGAAGRALIMGCNYPFDSGNRYVDAVRVGGDIHARWENVKRNSTAVSVNFWGTGRHWLCDPDFALCRSFDTSDDPDINTLAPTAMFGTLDGPYIPEVSEYRQVDAHLPQIEILLSLDLVSGGAVNLSDRMDRLNAKGVELARRLVSAVHGEQGLPLDLYQSAQPAVWLQKLPDGRHRVLLINWSDEPKAMSFDFAAHGIQCSTATDFWHDGKLPVANGVLTASVPPRGCLFAETDA